MFFCALLFISCNNNKHHKTSKVDNATIYDNNNVNIQHEENIPNDYTKQSPQKYVPINSTEENLFNYLREYSCALNTKNAKKIVELHYPDYFVLLQKKIPNKSIKEIKEKVQLYFEQNFDDIIGEYTKEWPKAKYADSHVSNIINRVKEGQKLLYLYEYHTMLYNETDTIYKKEAEYSVVVSLDNGKTWYSTSNDTDDTYDLLSMKFNKASIDNVFSKH